MLLAAMGSPDARQIDGLGGAHPLTSKVAVISRSAHAGADVDYLFLQVVVDRAEVSDSQNCGNILAGVGPWAIENGLVPVAGAATSVRIHMVNTGSTAVAHVPTPQGAVEYEGELASTACPDQPRRSRSSFSTSRVQPRRAAADRHVTDTLDGIELTCIDNGMPVIILRAADLGVTGAETPARLRGQCGARREGREHSPEDGAAHESRRRDAQDRPQDVPGECATPRRFDRHGHVHSASRARGHRRVRRRERGHGLRDSGSVAAQLAQRADNAGRRIEVEHPTGFFTVDVDVEVAQEIVVRRATLLRTARKLMRGDVFVPGAIWSRK